LTAMFSERKRGIEVAKLSEKALYEEPGAY
jgi:hypothetical protein